MLLQTKVIKYKDINSLLLEGMSKDIITYLFRKVLPLINIVLTFNLLHSLTIYCHNFHQ